MHDPIARLQIADRFERGGNFRGGKFYVEPCIQIDQPPTSEKSAARGGGSARTTSTVIGGVCLVLLVPRKLTRDRGQPAVLLVHHRMTRASLLALQNRIASAKLATRYSLAVTAEPPRSRKLSSDPARS